jgi:AAHS family 4-hydroxybenzoate transporter-like MFS transporter
MTLVNDTALVSLTGYSRAATVVVAIAFALMMVDGYDMFIMSFVAPLVAQDLHLPASRLGELFAAGLFGSVLGGLALGPVADRFGRQPIVLVSLAAAGVSTFLCSRAQSFEFFAALRFITGFALGGLLAAAVPLVAEYFPPQRRSGAVTLMFIGYPLGAVVGGAITALLLAYGWRRLFWGTGLLTLLVIPAAFLLRETLRAPNQVARDPAEPVKGTPILELFTAGRFWPTLLTSSGIFCLLLLAYLLNSWTPTIAVKAGLPPATAALCGVFLNLGGVMGALLSIPASRRFGVFKVAAVMVGIGSPAIALLGHLFDSPGMLFSALFIAGLLVIGGQQNAPAMSVLLYPQRMRATGAGWQFGVGRLGSIFGPVIGGYLLAAGISAHSLFLLMAVPAVLAAGCYAVVNQLSAQ